VLSALSDNTPSLPTGKESQVSVMQISDTFAALPRACVYLQRSPRARYMAVAVRWRHHHHSWRVPRVIRYGGGEPFSSWWSRNRCCVPTCFARVSLLRQVTAINSLITRHAVRFVCSVYFAFKVSRVYCGNACVHWGFFFRISHHRGAAGGGGWKTPRCRNRWVRCYYVF